MSKRSGLSIVALTVLAGSVVFYGMKHVEDQKEDMLKDNHPDVNVAAEETSNNAQESEVSIDESNLDRLSLEQFLHYKAETNGEARVAFYGDVSMDQPGLSQWTEELKGSVGEQLSIEDATFPDYDTYELYIMETAASVSGTDADAILFFLPAYPDKERDMGLDESRGYFQSIIQIIQQLSPETLLILVEPYPMEGEAMAWNSRSLDYTNYLTVMQEVIEEEGLPVFAVHDSFNQEVEATSRSMSELLSENGTDLNEEGEEVFLQVFNEWTQQELDTSEWVH
ncbi:hypothetical protein [Atopococcus tabaci]|uniref:hypothetical protein n=1 Tax=Atopococcus tabaci TaxID=269774 RepID=UPI000414A82D|nr:hypothetical protein [Atopococcus tabaci]